MGNASPTLQTRNQETLCSTWPTNKAIVEADGARIDEPSTHKVSSNEPTVSTYDWQVLLFVRPVTVGFTSLWIVESASLSPRLSFFLSSWHDEVYTMKTPHIKWNEQCFTHRAEWCRIFQPEAQFSLLKVFTDPAIYFPPESHQRSPIYIVYISISKPRFWMKPDGAYMFTHWHLHTTFTYLIDAWSKRNVTGKAEMLKS